MTRFLITGLPRSRTAWLAAVADGVPGAICAHEPTRRFNRWQDIEEYWQQPGEWVGAADSLLGLHLREIVRDYGPRVLVVDRPIAEVAESLRRIGLPATEAQLQVLARRIDAGASSPLVHRIAYDRLNDGDVVCNVLRFLMPGADVDETRIGRLMGWNIQASPELARAAVAGRDMTKLLGDALSELT